MIQRDPVTPWQVAADCPVLRGKRNLRYVLTHIADHPVNQVDDFLPWNVTSYPG
jgi:hypothetical protein